MGMVYDAHGLDEAAIHCYEQATRLDAGDPRPWYHLAVVKSRRGEIDHAIEAMRAAVERDSGYAPACWRLGMTLVEKGEADEAERWFRRAIEIDGHDSGGWLGLARLHLDRRADEQAAEILERMLETARGNEAYAHHLLGMAYRRLGRHTEGDAAALRGRAVRAVWDDPWRGELARFRSGRLATLWQIDELLRTGELDEAVSILEALRRRWPDDPTVMIDLAIAHRKKGRFRESLDGLERVIVLQPDSYPAHFQMAATYYQLSRQPGFESPPAPRDRAIEHARRAIELNPSYARAHGLLGEIHLLSHRPVEAIARFREASRCEPSDPTWPYRRGLAQLRLERWSDAAQSLRRATGLGLEKSAAFRGLALAEMMLGRFDDAERALQQAMRVNPGDPAIPSYVAKLDRMRTAGAAPVAAAPDREPD